MQITLSFEAHELPSLLSELVKLIGADNAGALASKVIASQRETAAPSYDSPSPAVDHSSVFIGEPVGALDETPFQPAATTAEGEPKKRRGRRPKIKEPPPHVSLVSPSDLPPSVTSLVAGETPAATASHASPQVPPPASAVAAGVTLDDVRRAYASLESRMTQPDAAEQHAMAVLKHFGVEQFRNIPEAQWTECVDMLNAAK